MTAGGSTPSRRASKRAADTEAPNSQQDASTATQSASKRTKLPALPSAPVGTRYEESMRRPKPSKCLTIMSWNVAGLRGLMKKDAEAVKRLIEAETVDVLCLQEHKLQEKNVSSVEEKLLIEGWDACWSCSTDKAGYSGAAILWKKDSFRDGPDPKLTCGIGNDKHDTAGRVVTMTLPSFTIVNVYVPNAGDKLKNLEYRVNEWDVDFAQYLEGLRKGSPVILAGDMNCARQPIDIHNAKGNVKSAGFSPEERESFQKVYMDAGWVDTFREQHPDVHGYTYYSYRFGMRAKKKGWRLDYFVVSPDISKRCHDSFILQEFLGSDHCPIGLVVDKAEE